MPDPAGLDSGLPDPAVPDPTALRRRILITAVASLALYLAVAFTIASAGLPDWWLLVAMGAVYGLVIRPMMQPVRDASRLRRSLAYQAFLEHKDDSR
jgi:hypothetical protein